MFAPAALKAKGILARWMWAEWAAAAVIKARPAIPKKDRNFMVCFSLFVFGLPNRSGRQPRREVARRLPAICADRLVKKINEIPVSNSSSVNRAANG
jgi:hypothetical protein